VSVAVSVVIPTFNRPLLVQEAIDSVLAQHGAQTFEIIVVDDGSTPETGAALHRYGDRIRYVRQENAGLNAARNHALRLATGEFIALLDDDDVWLPSKTALQLQALQRFPDAGFVHSDFFIWKPEAGQRPRGLQTWFTEPYTRLYSQHETLSTPDSEPSSHALFFGDLYYWSLLAPMVLPSTALIRRAALEGLLFPDRVSTCGDWEFFARLSHSHGAVFLATELVLNRSHEDAGRLTRGDPGMRLRRRIDMIHRVWRNDAQFMQHHTGEVAQVELQCLRKLARLLWASGATREARAVTREMSALRDAPSGAGDLLLKLLVAIPGSSVLARLLRAYRNRHGERQAAS
jgi:glycosyltransferase involved in cell wall biosynthesis